MLRNLEISALGTSWLSGIQESFWSGIHTLLSPISLAVCSFLLIKYSSFYQISLFFEISIYLHLFCNLGNYGSITMYFRKTLAISFGGNGIHLNSFGVGKMMI